MNKLGKFLAFAGVTSALAYLTYGLKGTPAVPKKVSSTTRGKDIKESEPTSDYSDARTQKMYKDLGMTDEQRRRYENDYRAVMSAWDKKSPSAPMDDKQKVDEHNSVLNAVLNEAQYSMYRDWFKNNPA